MPTEKTDFRGFDDASSVVESASMRAFVYSLLSAAVMLQLTNRSYPDGRVEGP